MAHKEQLLKESGYGTSSTYGEYNTYSDESYTAHQNQQTHPFATSAGYAYSPEPIKPNSAIKRTQTVLAGSCILFIAAIALSFTANVQTAQQVGHFAPGAAVSAGVCSVLVALLLYGTVGYLMHRRENNGRMIGVAFSLLGIIMGLASAVVCFISGSSLLLFAGVLYLGVVAFNAIWLMLTNKPALYNSLRK